ncbi:MAG: cupin domain-containing protein [Proteobacteria bacterium]|nr:cupin domain-containing protein [Burkholderiales bacterium]
MSASTPDLAHRHAALAALASRFVDVEALPWRDTPSPKISMKVLLEDPASGLLTALFRWGPGAVLGDHEHVRIEQSFILEGSIEDDEGECAAGNFVWRPAGSRHAARSPKGALVLAFFLAPNRFLVADRPD